MKKIDIKDINLSIARRINEKKSKSLNIIPFKEDEEYIYVFVLNKNYEKSKEIYFVFRKKVNEIVISEEEFEYLYKVIYIGQKGSLKEIILKEAIDLKASDIHIEPYKEQVLIRFRVDGFLRNMYLLQREEYLALISQIKTDCDLDFTEKRRPADGEMTIEINNNHYDLRISIIPLVYGQKIVIRILYGDIFNYSLEKLNLTKSQISKLKTIMQVSNGFVIVNGPTGSGKSTTLYTMLQQLNNEEVNITTLEDPNEAIIPGICQMVLNTNLNIDFSEGLKRILRQDPDIIMVGEIRDEETASITVRAALTGHKVYSTLHTRDAREVYLRLENMGIENYLIRDSLVGIISQRLIRLLCDECKKEVEKINILGEKVNSYEKCGCSKCNYTGYKGRGLLAAIHVIDGSLRENIKNIYCDNSILSNYEMIDNLNVLLKKGKISLIDYKNFIEWEGIKYKYEKYICEEC